MATKVKRKYGGSKRSLEDRKRDNKGVKDGTVRRGAKGRTYRRYNAKTGRWQVIKTVDKEGRTRKTKKVSKPSTSSSSSSPTKRTTTRVSPSARGEGSKRKPNKTKTYNPGAGTGRAKTPGEKGYDRVAKFVSERGGNAAKTRGRDATVKAKNKRVVTKAKKTSDRRKTALSKATQARLEAMRKYR